MPIIKPPYKWGYAHVVQQDGDASVDQLWSKRQAGYIRSHSVAFGGDGGDAGAMNGLGFYYYPGKTSGLFNVAATIHYNYTWVCQAYLASASVFGSIGLQMTRFDLAGNYLDDAIWAQTWLWEDNSSWSADSDSNSSASAQLNAQCVVDGEHYYNMWVFSTTFASNTGDGLVSSSASESYLNVRVDAIAYDLG